MEILSFRFASAPALAPLAAAKPALCGVVGSGNLEVLLCPAAEAEECTVEISTSAWGFGDTWQAVLAAFAAAHPAGGTHIAIHDMGATPAVVTLRLGQTLAEYREGGR